MALGYRYADDADFEHSLQIFLASSQQEGLHDSPALHSRPGGWYSSEVIAQAISAISMRKAGKVEYDLKLQPLYVDPVLIHRCVGALVNLDDEHWVALKAISGKIWLLDSLKKKPRLLQEGEYLAYVNKRRAAYPIYWAEDMGLPGESISGSPGENAGPALPLLTQAATTHDSMEVEMAPQADDDVEASCFAGGIAVSTSTGASTGAEDA